MAAIARFGFERGLVPSNVSVMSASFVTGRNSGTAAQAIASGSTEFGNIVDNNSTISVSGISTDTIFYSCQYKRTAANSNASMSLVQFGNVWVEYEPTSSRVTFRRGKGAAPGYDILFTSPATVVLPIGTWVPVSGKFIISPTVGEILINIDSIAYSATGLNTSQGWSGTYTTNTMQPIIIPQGVTNISISLSGAGGGSYDFGSIQAGGAGGFASGVLPVKSGQIYWAIAGSGGGNSTTIGATGAGGSPGGSTGGASYAGGGGGYTGIFTSSIASQGNAVAVAGAGGGSTFGSIAPAGGNPGAGGPPLQGTGGGGAGYLGGNSIGGSNFLRADITSQTNTQGGGASGGSGNGGTAPNGSVAVSSTLDKTTLIFGLGVAQGNVLVGKPTFQLDDVAVNNTYTGTNTTGSFGASDITTPTFISSVAVEFSSTGSSTVGWNTPGGNLISAVSGSGVITSSFFPRPVLQLKLTSSLPISTIEGLNLYFQTASREGSSGVYISPGFALSNPTASAGLYNSFPLSSLGKSGSVSIFEKDLGGKLTLSELNSGSVYLNSSAFINKNFFGLGTDGNVRYTASTNIGDSVVDGNYVIMQYKNLIVDSGATLSVPVTKKGLILYVQGDCIINGTISMAAGKGASGFTVGGFIFDKNVSTSSFSEYSSSLHTVGTISSEQLYQPFLSGQSTELGISGSFSAAVAGSTGTGTAGTSGVNRNPGGGGAGGGHTASPYSAAGGSGGSSGTFSGGSGGGAGAYPTTPGSSAGANGGAPGSPGGGYGGGVIYIIVGNTLLITGTISASGANGATAGAGGDGGSSGGGGGGGGSINIVYGKNLINTGTISANGGSGGSAFGSAHFVGGAGGAGSITITKVLSN